MTAWMRPSTLTLTACGFFVCGFSSMMRGEVQTQHSLDTSVAIGPVEPLWHLRVRTTPEGGGLAQIRTGPILNFEVKERATLIVGYYFTRAKEERSWNTTHRTFGGVEVAAWKRKIEVDVRSLVERFAVASAPDYTRFRNRIRISPAGVTAPYAGIEGFVDADGFRSVRYSAGIRRAVTEELLIDFGYFYEDRQSRAGADRHVVGTTIHWRDKSTRLDSDR
jgi:hypothetical protein